MPALLLNVDHKLAEDFRHFMQEENGGEKFTFKIGDLKIRAFYQLEIMWHFTPTLVILRAITSWVSTAISILVLVGLASEDGIMQLIGAAVLFAGSLILNLFGHGFIQYPSASKMCATGREEGMDTSEFDKVRDLASAAYNDDHEHRSQWGAIALTLPFTLPVHLVSFCVTCLSWIIGCGKDGDKGRAGHAGDIGIFVACCFYPLVYVYAGSYGIIYAQAGLIATENLYDAMFFRKSFGKFLLSFVFGFLDLFIEDANAGKVTSGLFNAGGVANEVVANADLEMADEEEQPKKKQPQKALSKTKPLKNHGRPTKKPIDDDDDEDETSPRRIHSARTEMTEQSAKTADDDDDDEDSDDEISC